MHPIGTNLSIHKDNNIGFSATLKQRWNYIRLHIILIRLVKYRIRRLVNKRL
jgi:hypothetical protein